MSADDEKLQTAIYYYKTGHTLSLDEHIHTIPAKVPPRSALLKRGNSVPKMPLDTTFEVVQEDINRKVLHRTILDRNPAAFRRTASETSCAKYASQKHSVRDLLPTIHPVSDPHDISPPKFGYNFTKLPRQSQELRTNLEDFLQPQSQVIPRQTGYSKGHIRTVLELDTFGPNHSDSVSEGRSLGSLPQSPNLDRNAALSPIGSRMHSRAQSPSERSRSGLDSKGGPEVQPERLPGGALTGTVRLDLNKCTSAPELGTMPIIGTADIQHAMDAVGNNPIAEITLPRPSTAGFVEDARGNSLLYTKRREEKLKDKREEKERYAKTLLDRQRQQREAEELSMSIDTFELNLKSTKSYL